MSKLPFFGVAGLTAAAMIAAPALSAEQAAPVYLLSMHLTDGTRLIGSPRLKVAAGEATQIEIGDKAGNHYDIHVTLTPRADATVAFDSTIEIASADGTSYRARPSLRVAPGKKATIEFGKVGPDGGPFHADFTVEQVD